MLVKLVKAMLFIMPWLIICEDLSLPLLSVSVELTMANARLFWLRRAERKTEPSASLVCCLQELFGCQC